MNIPPIDAPKTSAGENTPPKKPKLKQTTVTEMMGQTQTQDSNYNDYKRFGSLLIPTSTSVPLGPQSVDATLGTVKINGKTMNPE